MLIVTPIVDESTMGNYFNDPIKVQRRIEPFPQSDTPGCTLGFLEYNRQESLAPVAAR